MDNTCIELVKRSAVIDMTGDLYSVIATSPEERM